MCDFSGGVTEVTTPPENRAGARRLAGSFEHFP
jgi:hypothetical protein